MTQVTNYLTPGSPLTMAGLKFFNDDVFQAIASGNLGINAPSNPFDGMTWVDTSESPLWSIKIYSTVSGWREMATFEAASGEWAFHGAGRVFSSVSEMEAAKGLSVGQFVRTLGYSETGDGGGNDYEIVAAATGTDDGGSFIDLAGSGLQAKGLFPGQVVTPRQFGAKGDGNTDDRSVIQRTWDFSAANLLTVDMMGLEYNCSEAVYTRSNLAIRGQYATMYITAWPAVGAFVTNVVAGEPLERVQSNIKIDGLILDGSKLPAPVDQDSNLMDFARGAYNVRVSNCISRKIRDGNGSGTGGGGFGCEQGGSNIAFINCVAEDCYRAFRVAGIPGNHDDAAAESKRAINIRVHDLTVRRCGTAVLAHAIINHGDTDQSDLGRFDCLIDGLYIEDSGHYPWRDFDFDASPGINPQKTGVIVFAGAQNVCIRNVRVKLNSTYPASFTDWLGRTGYPAANTDKIGEGLSGAVGALVWGWGRNIVIDGITLDGTVDNLWKCHRAVTFGEVASISPTDGIDGSVQQVLFNNVRPARGGYGYVFDGQAGLDNALFSAQVRLQARNTAPSSGVIGDNGTSALSNLLVEDIRTFGFTSTGNAVEWLAFGNAFPASGEINNYLGGIELGGGVSTSGAKNGLAYVSSADVLRSSRDITTSAAHIAFYNPNGFVGQIATSASSTSYGTSSDERLKGDFQDIDGLSVVLQLQVYDFEWVNGGRGVGGTAQQWHAVFPDAVLVGDDESTWNASDVSERTPWSIDYTKAVPLLVRAVQQLSDRLRDLEGR